MLAIGPTVRGMKPGLGQWNFEGDKICNTISFCREIKMGGPIWHVKEPFTHAKRWVNFWLPSKFPRGYCGHMTVESYGRQEWEQLKIMQPN